MPLKDRHDTTKKGYTSTVFTSEHHMFFLGIGAHPEEDLAHGESRWARYCRLKG
jgi:hypothetical protein